MSWSHRRAAPGSYADQQDEEKEENLFPANSLYSWHIQGSVGAAPAPTEQQPSPGSAEPRGKPSHIPTPNSPRHPKELPLSAMNRSLLRLSKEMYLVRNSIWGKSTLLSK